MCNNKAGTAFHHGSESLLDTDLGAGIDGRGCLIEDQHRRQAQHDAGNAQKLLLPLGKITAILGDHRVISIRHTLDKAVGMRLLCRPDDLLLGRVRLAVGNILPDGSGL